MRSRSVPLCTFFVGSALVLSVFPFTAALAAINSSSCAAMDQIPAVVEVGQGMQQELRAPLAITRVAIGDPKIADVQPTGTDGFTVTGVETGVTSLMVWTACSKEPRQSMIFVKGRATNELATTSIPPSQYPLLPSQVQADIRFVEVSRSKLKEAGTSIFGKGSNNFLFGAPGTVPGVTVSPGTVSATLPAIPLANDMFNIVWGGGSSKVLGMINALENSGFAYTLARPSLTVLSGLTATFLAGGEIPIPVPSSGSDTVSIEYKEFGIRLALSPTVISKDRIVMKVAPEVSELDYANAVTIAGVAVPALTVRRTDTSISLADGESFVISGLISSNNRSAVNKFPGLGDIPILGAFFRSSAVQSDERELLMIVTPHLVQPLAANAALPQLPGERLRTYDPNWYRLFFLENGDFDRRSGLSQ